MEIFILAVIILSSIICILLGIIIGYKTKEARISQSSPPVKNKPDNIDNEIVPYDPFPLTTALDQKDSLEIKRSIRDSSTPLLLNPTGGLHASKVRSKDSWLRF
jgi:hypothetical protein